jgi:hypothetical protein
MEFDKSKIITQVTCDQVKVGDIGWVADTWKDVQIQTERCASCALDHIDPEEVFPFRCINLHYAQFYPAPKPTHRPFKDALECLAVLMDNHNYVADKAGQVSLCAVFDNASVMITRKNGINLWSFEFMLEQGYTIDGKPFGVK